MDSGLKAALGVVIAILVIGGLYYVINHPDTVAQTVNPTVTVTAVDLQINYQGSTDGYMGPTSQSLGGFTISAGNQETYTLTFNTTALLLQHQINSLTISTSGFSLSSLSPNMPYSFSAGSTVSVTLTINVPSSSYSGVLDIVLDTT
jgi:hypothetical protein